MNDNDLVVVFCNATVAKELIDTDPEIKDALVVTNLLPDSDAIIVKQDEFLEWLNNKEDEFIDELYEKEMKNGKS